MREIFGDTSFYQALINPRDAWHAKAVDFSRGCDGDSVTTQYVLVEPGALMARSHMRPFFIELIDRLGADPATCIAPASSELFESGFSLFARRTDKEWSLTDTISSAMIAQRGIKEVVGTDRHFEQAGFRLLLRR